MYSLFFFFKQWQTKRSLALFLLHREKCVKICRCKCWKCANIAPLRREEGSRVVFVCLNVILLKNGIPKSWCRLSNNTNTHTNKHTHSRARTQAHKCKYSNRFKILCRDVFFLMDAVCIAYAIYVGNMYIGTYSATIFVFLWMSLCFKKIGRGEK